MNKYKIIKVLNYLSGNECKCRCQRQEIAMTKQV